MRTCSIEVRGDKAAKEIAAEIVHASQWFTFEPLPMGKYTFTVKEENKGMLDQLVEQFELIFSHAYECTECPECHANLTLWASVNFTAADNNGESLGQRGSRLDADGLLEDQDGLIAGGFHSGTYCAACGESLADYESF